MFRRSGCLALALAALILPAVADASGGSSTGGGGGGGGGGGTVTSRLVGLATAIDYYNRTIVIGQLYYGSGGFKVAADCKVTINNTNGTFEDVQLNDYCEIRYDAFTRVVSKIAVTR